MRTTTAEKIVQAARDINPSTMIDFDPNPRPTGYATRRETAMVLFPTEELSQLIQAIAYAACEIVRADEDTEAENFLEELAEIQFDIYEGHAI